MLNHPYFSGIKPTWLWCIIFLILYLIEFAKTLLKILENGSYVMLFTWSILFDIYYDIMIVAQYELEAVCVYVVCVWCVRVHIG